MFRVYSGIMSLHGLLTRGIEQVLSLADAELDELLASQQLPRDAGEHIEATVRAMPGLLSSMQAAMAKPDAPKHARELFLVAVDYLLTEDDLIPSHAGQPLYGLLDDVYLLHVAAYELRDHVGPVDERSVAGGMALLEMALPRDVVTQLKAKVHAARRIGH